MAVVAEESGRSRGWSIVGGMGVATAYTIAITYAVVVGWVLWYLARALSAGFAGFDAGIAEATFTGLLTDNQSMMFWTLVGNIIVGSIIYAGVTSGIERAVTVMMPLMFTLSMLWQPRSKRLRGAANPSPLKSLSKALPDWPM